jgi:catechol 2,3-dioxygenase-like lactoylglutathione lyase family enzyme
MAAIQGVAHVRVFVRPGRWEAACSFYGKTLGLRCIDRRTGVFELPDGVTLGIEKADPRDREGRELTGRFLAVSFRVTDVHRAYRRISRKGVRFHGPPEKQPWGGTLAFLRDPGGNTVSLAEYPRLKKGKP